MFIFDHMQGYYGVSSLESLSQGKPVIAGLDEWNIHCIKDLFGASRLPWILARDALELQTALEDLAKDMALRAEIGKKARGFMEAFWNEKRVVTELISAYHAES